MDSGKQCSNRAYVSPPEVRKTVSKYSRMGSLVGNQVCINTFKYLKLGFLLLSSLHIMVQLHPSCWWLSLHLFPLVRSTVNTEARVCPGRSGWNNKTSVGLRSWSLREAESPSRRVMDPDRELGWCWVGTLGRISGQLFRTSSSPGRSMNLSWVFFLSYWEFKKKKSFLWSGNYLIEAYQCILKYIVQVIWIDRMTQWGDLGVLINICLI